MEQIKVGIDFGTSQTKICSRNIEGGHYFTFHKFSENNKYVFPSTISLNSNGKCDFGKNDGSPVRYFKMKSLFADNIFYRTNENSASTTFSLNNHPEICCILYLCYCILDVKDSFTGRVELKSAANDDNLSEHWIIKALTRFFKKKSPAASEINNKNVSSIGIADYTFHYTIGIPTRYDWSREEHNRRGLQYEMLYLASDLSNSYRNISDYLDDNIDIYLDKIKTAYAKLLLIDPQDLFKFYLSNNIYVIAETTAGIFVLQDQFQRTLLALENNPVAQDQFIKSKLGNYITMDVGAGTTDISFFRLGYNENKVKLNYYASQAIDCASNYIIVKYLELSHKRHNITDDEVAAFDFQKDENIWKTALVETRNKLSHIIRTTLLPDLLNRFNNSFKENWQFDELSSRAKGCKVYGGGSKLTAFSEGELVLNNQGNPGLNDRVRTTTRLSELIIGGEYLANIQLRNSKGDKLNDKEKAQILHNLHLLNTALGLSLVDLINRPDHDQINRNNDNSQFGYGDEDTLNPNGIDPLSNGPLDQGMARFDIFNRDWI